jgi:glycerol-3-phosphate acyltransferase PlsY
MTILVAIMVYRHHENIGRIKAGTERKVHWMDRKKKEETSN